VPELLQLAGLQTFPHGVPALAFPCWHWCVPTLQVSVVQTLLSSQSGLARQQLGMLEH
jgi:hypothetical protein